jgi:phage-related minor tail protein
MAEDRRSLGAFEEQTSRAGDALSDLAEERAVEAAATIEEAFARAGASIERSLTAAARTGENVFDTMARKVLSSLADLAIDKIVAGPLAQIVEGALGGVPFARPRADGGPVLPGGAYLVGERGPELFVPASAGAIDPSPAAAVAVHFHISGGGDADALRRSQGQIATLVARAVARGRSRL